MSSTDRRRGGSGDIGGYLAAGAGGVYLLIGVVMWAGLHLDQFAQGGDQTIPGPATVPIAAATGGVTFSGGAIGATLVLGVLLLLLAAGAGTAWWRRRKPNRHIDRAAVHMARGAELDKFTRRTVDAKTAELRIQAEFTGLPLGRAVAGGTPLWLGGEGSAIGLAGARVGKTTSIVIPWILAAPGACLVTSNRRDVVDGTRGVRLGAKYVFDPQQIVGETATFYWNPLTYILSGPQGTEVKAQALANIFATASAPPESRKDRFFDPKGENHLAHYLHAAALKGHPITKVYEWITDEKDTEPAEILAEHGFPLSAKAVLAVLKSHEKQRGGVFATSELCISWLTNRAAVEWLTPGPHKVAFDPAEFAASRDTIYLISREGRDTQAALTTALTAAICEAAEHLASQSYKGRLPVPLVCVLDEVANVCRWPELPNLYSHYGGRGIILLSILQSWSQGVGVWGERALSAMWSTSQVNLFLGGVREVRLLHELRELVGKYRTSQVSSTSSRQGHSTNLSQGEEDILSTADLAAIPPGRAIMLASGIRPVLVRTQPWWDTEHNAAVKASYAVHDPNSDTTLAEAEDEAAEWDVAPAGARWSR